MDAQPNEDAHKDWQQAARLIVRTLHRLTVRTLHRNKPIVYYLAQCCKSSIKLRIAAYATQIDGRMDRRMDDQTSGQTYVLT